jgi:RNA polymerase sigma-70 factor (ECF subfamily)
MSTAPATTRAPATAVQGGKKCPCTAEQREDFLGWVARLVHQHRAYLLRVVRGEGLGPEDAFDAVQEAFQTFLTLPAARALAPACDDAGKMLTTIARNAARNQRRRAAVARPHDSDDAVLAALATPASVEEMLADAENEVRLRGCVDSLGDMQRMVVTLRMLDEIAGEDVARTLGVTPGHVAVLLHRAKANLLACMTGEARDANQ